MDYVVVCIIYLVQGVIMGLVSHYIAQSKGYAGGFAWGFWLSIIGILVVGFRPNRNSTDSTAEYRPMYPEAQPKPKPNWECGCGAKNPDTLNYCLSCRSDRGTNKPVEKVKCPHCGANNRITNKLCFACNKPLKENDEVIAQDISVETKAISNDFSTILEKLAKLHEQGILTDDEYKQKKADVLTRI